MRLRHQQALAGILLAAGAFSVSAPRVVRAVVSGTRIGFPSSVATDGKFLSLPGKGMSSFNVPTHLSIGVPSSEAANTFQVEIFDGDQGGRWDKPGGATTTYELFTDANRDGNGMQLVTSLSNTSFVDDDWGVLYTGPHVPAAAAPSGNHFYRLVITLTGDAGVLNACKAAIVGAGQIGAIQNEFSCIGGVVQTGRAAGSGGYDQVMTTTDPLPGTALNTYDGTFAFAIYVGAPGQSVALQEGDADHYQDLTAAVGAEAALPSKAGVAADGQRGNVLGGVNVDYGPFMVGGAIAYKVKAPNGTVLVNVTDPSGDG